MCSWGQTLLVLKKYVFWWPLVYKDLKLKWDRMSGKANKLWTCYYKEKKEEQSLRSVAPGLKKSKDDKGATVPYVLKSCNYRHTQNYASFGLIHLIFTKFLWNK